MTDNCDRMYLKLFLRNNEETQLLITLCYAGPHHFSQALQD